MHGIAVALLTEDREHLLELQRRVEATRLGRAVFSNVGFPLGSTDSILAANSGFARKRSSSSTFLPRILNQRSGP